MRVAHDPSWGGPAGTAGGGRPVDEQAPTAIDPSRNRGLVQVRVPVEPGGLYSS
jgi:hypothetical protein